MVGLQRGSGEHFDACPDPSQATQLSTKASSLKATTLPPKVKNDDMHHVPVVNNLMIL